MTLVLNGLMVVDESVRIEDGRFAVLDSLVVDVGPGSVVFVATQVVVVFKTLPAVTPVLLPQFVPLSFGFTPVLFPHLVALTLGVVLPVSPVLLPQPEAVELSPTLTTVSLPQLVTLPVLFAPVLLLVLFAMFLGVVLVAEV